MYLFVVVVGCTEPSMRAGFLLITFIGLTIHPLKASYQDL